MLKVVGFLSHFVDMGNNKITCQTADIDLVGVTRQGQKINREWVYQHYRDDMNLEMRKEGTSLRREGEVQDPKLDFLYFSVKSSTLHGILTFYRMKISSHTL